MSGLVKTMAAVVGSLAIALTGCTGQIGADPQGASPPTPEPVASPEPEGEDPGPEPITEPEPPASRVSAILGSSDATECSLMPTRVWKLTPRQLERSMARVVSGDLAVESAIALTVADSGAQFSSLAAARTMSTPHFEALLTMADLAADALVLQDVDDCAAATIDGPCRRALVDRLGARAFRRPLTEDERAAFVSFVEAEELAAGPQAAFHQLVRAIVLSPEFLYRTELGSASGASASGEVRLTDYEVASALSYLLTDGPPDDALMAAAADGALGDSEARRAHARRLMARWRDAPGLARFFDEWFSISAALDAPKNGDVFPGFEGATRRAAVDSTHALIEHVLYDGDGRLATLVTTPTAMLSTELGWLYDRPVAGSELASVIIDDQPRAGLLTTPSFLAVQAQDNASDIVKRGRFVREALLCQHLPAPPSDVDAVFPPADGIRTQRERLASVHSTQPSCQGCHALMDPIGYALETFDGIGRFRTEELGRPIDATGELLGTSAIETTFDGPAELAAVLVQTEELPACFVRTFHDFAFGQTEVDGNGCLLNDLFEQFQQTGGDVRALVEAWVASDAFVVRTRSSDG